MDGVLGQITRLGAPRIAAMLVVVLGLAGFFGFVIFRMSQPAMGLLYSDLAASDAGQVIRELETRNVRYEMRSDGQAIFIPAADIPRVRMELAGKGLPQGGGVGYEIFDKGDAFSSTSFVQNINHLRALEGELARSIRGIGRVQAARVHLVLPERRLFEREREGPRASIVLKLRGDLDSGQVRAIRHLAASAVEGLKPEKVSIVDESGRLLADGAQGDSAMAGAEERQATLERRLRAQVEDIVASVVGHGRARVQVSAQFDMNRIETRAETFDPESRVARSTQTRTEANTSTEPRDQGVSVGNELPGANAAQQPNQPGGAREAGNKNEEITNFEISRTTRTEVVEGGRLRRLSVAVLVDGVYAPAQGAEPAYQPRPQEELDRIGALVRTAIGFDGSRGDQVEVVNLRFAASPQALEVPERTLMQQFTSFSRDEMLRAIELGVIGLLTLIVLLTVVRPLMKQILAPDPRGGPGVPIGGGHKALPAPADPGDQTAMLENAVDLESASASERMVAMAQIKGQIKAQSVEKIGQMVKQNPGDSVAVIRSWVHEQSAQAV